MSLENLDLTKFVDTEGLCAQVNSDAVKSGNVKHGNYGEAISYDLSDAQNGKPVLNIVPEGILLNRCHFSDLYQKLLSICADKEYRKQAEQKRKIQESLQQEQDKAFVLSVKYLANNAKSVLGENYELSMSDTHNELIQVCFDIIKSGDKVRIKRNEELFNFYTNFKVLDIDDNMLFQIGYYKLGPMANNFGLTVKGVQYDFGKPVIEYVKRSEPSFATFYSKRNTGFEDLAKLFDATFFGYCSRKDIKEFTEYVSGDAKTWCDNDRCHLRPKCAVYKQVYKNLQR
jgi:hypothetical protein